MKSQEKVKILLAEDNSGDVLLVRRALQKHQIEHELTVIEDGEAALRYLEVTGSSGDPEKCPDLILLDLNLPRCSGNQILERLKNDPVYQNSPVIVLTSSDSPHDRAKAIDLGAARYFCKPTDLAGFMSLGQVVQDVISSR
jgi:two-component system, chemotaxis family, response regulator Rcp1